MQSGVFRSWDGIRPCIPKGLGTQADRKHLSVLHCQLTMPPRTPAAVHHSYS
jgi:hypothetical protein